MPDEKASDPKDILTPEEFTALCRANPDLKFPDRRNNALNKGGAVDIYTATDGSILAVVRFVKITDAIRKEVEPLLAAARAKAADAKATETAEPKGQPS